MSADSDATRPAHDTQRLSPLCCQPRSHHLSHRSQEVDKLCLWLMAIRGRSQLSTSIYSYSAYEGGGVNTSMQIKIIVGRMRKMTCVASCNTAQWIVTELLLFEIA